MTKENNIYHYFLPLSDRVTSFKVETRYDGRTSFAVSSSNMYITSVIQIWYFMLYALGIYFMYGKKMYKIQFTEKLWVFDKIF